MNPFTRQTMDYTVYFINPEAALIHGIMVLVGKKNPTATNLFNQNVRMPTIFQFLQRQKIALR